jgi:hypothetical protein
MSNSRDAADRVEGCMLEAVIDADMPEDLLLHLQCNDIRR